MSSEITITILVVIIAVLISETTSNTASAAIVVPIGIFLAAAVDVNPTVPALAAVFGANYGFMLPVSTPPNAIVYTSGFLPITRMIKAGAVFDVIGAVLCVVGVTVMANAGGAGVALARPLALAVAAGAASVLPGFLVGALALQIRGDLDVGVEEVAAGVSVFFLAGAIGAGLGGRLADRVGALRALRVCMFVTAACLLAAAFSPGRSSC